MTVTIRTPMTRVRRAVSVALLGLVIAVPAGADALAQTPDDDERIEFAPGTDYGSVAGTTEAGVSDGYVLSAQEGQAMTVVVASVEQNAAVTVTGPDGTVLEPSGGPVFVGTLPATGDYRLEVSGQPDGAPTTYGIVVHIAALAAAPATTAPPAPSPTPTPAPAPTAAPTPGPTASPACGVDPQAAEIEQSIASVPVPDVIAGNSWVYGGESNFDRCATLSYARLDTAGGTGSSPVQLMLFHDGVFVGTASDCAFGFTSVDSTTDDSITVTYRWPREGDTNAAPSGQATVTYRWTGDAVVMEGELPAELLQLTGCAA